MTTTGKIAVTGAGAVGSYFGVKRGPELGVPTPVNATLYALVKFLEGARAR